MQKKRMMDKPRANERVEYVDSEGGDGKALVDLSKGGACCVYDRQLDNGTMVVVRFGSLKIRAKVTYCTKRTDGYRLGLQFWNPTAAEQKELGTLTDRFSCGVPVVCTVQEQAGQGTPDTAA